MLEQRKTTGKAFLLGRGLDPKLNVGMRRNKRRALGILSYLLGCLLACVTVLFGLVGFESNLHGLAYSLILAGLLSVAILLLIAAEWFFVPSARDALARDRRPPVGYLRAFGEDEPLVYDEISTGEGIIQDAAKAEDFLLSLNAVGPLVSIAEPNLRARLGMHPLGAHRDFVGPGDWRARVQELLDEAGMVVVAIGDSPGIEWEIDQARQRVGRQSLLLYLPPRPARAFTRVGRAKKEEKAYNAFKPLVERHFGVEMPSFSEATHIIGFDAEGKPVLPTNVSRSTWSFSERTRVRKAIRAQLAAVLDKVRPGVDLRGYELLGQPGRWVRTALAVAAAVAPVVVLFNDRTMSQNEVLAGALVIARTLPDFMILIGWVLLAHYFQRLWVWSIPLVSGLLLLLKFSIQWLIAFGHGYGVDINDLRYWMRLSSGFQTLMYLVLAVAVLALGLVMFSRRSAAKAGVPPRV